MKKLLLALFIFAAHLSFGQATGKIISNKPSGGTIIVDTINVASLLNLSQTTAGQTITLASLSSGGKTIYVRNIGSVSVTLSPGGTLPTGKMATLGWTGSAWSASIITPTPAVWGTITGTLSDQTDLQSALDAKVSDVAYNSTSWDGVTTIAPSKNAARDEFENRVAKTTGNILFNFRSASAFDITNDGAGGNYNKGYVYFDNSEVDFGWNINYMAAGGSGISFKNGGGTIAMPTANGTLALTSQITGTNSGTNTGDETTGRINSLYGYTPANAATVATNTSDIALRMMALIPTAVKTTTYAASANDFVPCDNTSGSFTITLPNAPVDKTVFGVKMVIQGGTNTITIACAGSDVINKAGGITSFSIPYFGQAYLLQYKSSSGIWYVIADDLPKSALDAIYAPIASPTFTGTVTGTFSGNITGNVTGNVTGSSGSTTGNAATVTNGIYSTTSAGGDLTGTYPNPTIKASVSLTTPILGVASSTSETITGTGGNGFLSLPTQSSDPATPSGGTVLFSNSNSKFSWRGSANNYVKTFDGSAATANRIYSLPDVTGTVITTGDAGTVTNTMLAGSIDLTSKVTGILPGTNGGTGVNNSTRTMTYAGNVAFTGAFNPTFSIPQSTTWTLPNTASEILAGLGTAQTFTAQQSFTNNIIPTAANTYDFGANSSTGDWRKAYIRTMGAADVSGTDVAGTNVTIGSGNGTGGGIQNTSQSASIILKAPQILATSLSTQQTSTRLGEFGWWNSGTVSVPVNDAMLWMGNNITPSFTNYALRVSTNSTILNNSSSIIFAIANSRTMTLSSGVITTGVSNSSVYRLTNGGANVNSHFFIDPAGTVSTAGALGYAWEATNGMSFTHANGTLRVRGWSAKLTTLVNTAGSESSDITWTPQNATDKFIVSGVLVANGIADASSAASGVIGEEIISTVSTYTNYTTTATYQNIASITLTAGDWDISGFGTFSSNASTITAAGNAIFAIATTTASATGAVEGKSIAYVPQAALLGTSFESVAIPAVKVSISASTTYYLTSQAAFTIGNPQYTGTIRARRLR